MSWASIASNQAVSCENLQDAVTNGIFTIKNTIPSSTPAKYKCVTKADADYYVNINTSNPGYVAKASNQLVVKNDLSSGAAPIYITVSSGLYPVTGPNNTAIGNIYNNTGGYVYFTVVFNSGGQGTGYVAGNPLFITGTVAPGGISVYGNITGFGTTLTSQFNTPLYSGIAAIATNGVYPFDLQKIDGYSSGSTLRIYYSTDFVNFTPIPIL
jgi:hypothetical protein